MTPGLMAPANFVGGPQVVSGGTVGVMGVVGPGQAGTPGAGPMPGTPQLTPANDWAMDLNTMGAKGDKTAGYRRKTAPGVAEANREGPPQKKRRKVPDKEIRNEKERERERERENISVAGSAKIASRVSSYSSSYTSNHSCFLSATATHLSSP